MNRANLLRPYRAGPRTCAQCFLQATEIHAQLAAFGYAAARRNIQRGGVGAPVTKPRTPGRAAGKGRGISNRAVPTGSDMRFGPLATHAAQEKRRWGKHCRRGRQEGVPRYTWGCDGCQAKGLSGQGCHVHQHRMAVRHPPATARGRAISPCEMRGSVISPHGGLAAKIRVRIRNWRTQFGEY